MTSAIKNLRIAAKYGMVLKVECRKCGHSAMFLASDVAKFTNPAKPLSDLPFRCASCNVRDVEVRASEYDRDRSPGIVVWRPMRLK